MWVPATLPASCTPRAPVSQFQAIWARVSTPFPTKLAGTCLPRPSLPFRPLPLLSRNDCRGGGPACDRPCVRICHLRHLWLCGGLGACGLGCSLPLWLLLASWRVFCVEGPHQQQHSCLLPLPPSPRPPRPGEGWFNLLVGPEGEWCGPDSIPFPPGSEAACGSRNSGWFPSCTFHSSDPASCCKSALSGRSGARMPTCPQVEITAAAQLCSWRFYLPTLCVQNPVKVPLYWGTLNA